MGKYDISQWRLAGTEIRTPSDPKMATGVRTGFTDDATGAMGLAPDRSNSRTTSTCRYRQATHRGENPTGKTESNWSVMHVSMSTGPPPTSPSSNHSRTPVCPAAEAKGGAPPDSRWRPSPPACVLTPYTPQGLRPRVPGPGRGRSVAERGWLNPRPRHATHGYRR